MNPDTLDDLEDALIRDDHRTTGIDVAADLFHDAVTPAADNRDNRWTVFLAVAVIAIVLIVVIVVPALKEKQP